MNTRSQTLDILRAIAVIAVLGRHMTPCPPELNTILFYLTALWNRGGWVGVDLFFVLSGFLISGLLFREHQKHGHIAIKNFFIRRGLKIYPPFYVLIFLTVVINIIWSQPLPIGGLIREILFLQNYGGGLWNHTWSLAVEEHFYIFLPTLLVLFLKFRRSKDKPFGWIPGVFAFIALTCLLIRVYIAFRLPYDHETHLFATHIRIDSLFSGVVVSYFYHYYPEKFRAAASRWRLFLLPLGILCFAPAFVLRLEATPFIYTFGLSLFWIGGCLILFSLVNLEPKASFMTKPLSFIGSHSYAIYLWHMPVAAWGINFPMKLIFGEFNWYFYAALYLIGSVLVGVVMSAIIDYPVLRFRDRLFPSRSQAVN